ncbi:uncharacterized protein [Temnothorax longispinosus]|uniref:Circadian clock-controlled protein n=1 Tax=Temnothorax longispinosus TaxID=300112 RepID=A0A4S2L1H1_9HYME|nr:Uncharacterized protein DBV15_02429 [Temnothorax longispinosus]
MAGQIQLTFLLVIVACMVHGTPLIDEQNHIFSDEIRANVDKTVDALLPAIREFILKNGMDPLRIIDLSEHIFPNLPGKLKGSVDLKKGWVQNLSLIKRTSHVDVIYKPKQLTLDMNLGFDVMDFNYEYDLKYLLYNRQGDVYGRFYKLDVNVVMMIDLNEYQLILHSIEFSKVGKYDIKFEGHLLDPLVNILSKIITVVFRGYVLPVIEEYSMTIFGATVNEWNTKIPRANRKEIIDELFHIAEM